MVFLTLFFSSLSLFLSWLTLLGRTHSSTPSPAKTHIGGQILRLLHPHLLYDNSILSQVSTYWFVFKSSLPFLECYKDNHSFADNRNSFLTVMDEVNSKTKVNFRSDEGLLSHPRLCPQWQKGATELAVWAPFKNSASFMKVKLSPPTETPAFH